MLSEEERILFERGLAQLSARDRGLIVARLEFGRSWNDLAEDGGLPSSDAARIVFGRAKAKLVALMAGYMEDEGGPASTGESR